MPRFLPVLAALLAAAPALAADRPPNVVLILADDMGSGDPGCYNPASKCPTPNIDRLATQGMRFTDANCPSGVCTPTRYGLLTGRYSWRGSLKKGVLNGYSPALIEPGRMTLASLLKAHGYRTAGVGKWHLGLGDAPQADFAKPLRPGPNAAGFDSYFGIPASLDMPPYVFFEDERVTEPPTGHVGASEMRRNGGNGFWRAGAIAPSFTHEGCLPRLTDRAVEAVRGQTPGKPFFLYFALTGPHTPWMPVAEFRGKSGAGYYGDFVVQVDDAVGRVLRALDEAKLADDTLVIFTSDNGAHWLPSDIRQWGHRANGTLRGQKSDIWEGGHRVPFVVRWPGKVKPGSVCGETVCLIDVLATVADVLGAKLPAEAGEDSFSLLPLLRGEKPTRDALVVAAGDGTLGVRQGPWKLVPVLGSHGFSQPATVKPEPGGPTGQLYRLDTDPAEATNLWQQQPREVERLTKLLQKVQADGRSRP
jgi:arylsulfatase A-like enzyme